MLGSDILVVWN